MASTDQLTVKASKTDRRYLNSLYPNEFEYYLCALELVDSLGKTVTSFVFPVMPQSITKTEPQRINVKKSASGTTVIASKSFVPKDLTIKGDFGKGFKFQSSYKEGVVVAWGGNTLQITSGQYDPNIKTGFAAIKILQSIISKASQTDQHGKMYRLYFYNLALSETYLVIPNPSGLVLSQNYEKNMIWNYSISLIVLADLPNVNNVASKTSSSQLMTSKNIVGPDQTTLAKMQLVPVDTLSTMGNLGRSVKKLWDEYSDFVLNYYTYMVNYYNGSPLVKEALSTFQKLYETAKAVKELTELYKNRKGLLKYWQVEDVCSDIYDDIDVVKNMGKWFRSSKSINPMTGIETGQNSTIAKVSYISKQGESLENISNKKGDIDSTNDWVNIAIDNDLTEEKYTSKGGVMMSIPLTNELNLQLNNIVDTLTQQNLYGKDIQKYMQIVDGDYVVLSGIDSLMQTFDTIFKTMKGSIPEFPEDGIDNGLIGSNVMKANYAFIFNDIYQMFQKDNRFKSVQLVDTYRKDDNVYLSVQATAKTEDVLKQDILI